jgi:hypothetical protein
VPIAATGDANVRTVDHRRDAGTAWPRMNRVQTDREAESFRQIHDERQQTRNRSAHPVPKRVGTTLLPQCKKAGAHSFPNILLIPTSLNVPIIGSVEKGLIWDEAVMDIFAQNSSIPRCLRADR